MTGPGERTVHQEADIVALTDSKTTSARPAHRIITTHLWRAVRTLGFDSGRVLVTGDDPGTFLGQPHTLGFGFESLTATVGPAHRPGDAIRAEVFADVEENFDVVIAAVPFNDVKLSYPVHQVRRRTLEHAIALMSVELTKPGGLTVILASHNLLDFPDPYIRRGIADRADLIGAVRLPGAIQRNVAGTDAVTDLIVLHRAAPTDPPSGPEFTDVRPVVMDGRTLPANTYFHDHPHHLLGTVGIEPVTNRPNALSVRANPTRFDANLGNALDDIATTARKAGIIHSSWARSGDVRPQTPDQVSADPRLNPPQTSARERDDLDGDPDWDSPNLGETGLGLW